MDVSLDALAAFEVVARLGSFTRAAAELHVTQSAVSHRVRALEEQLDCVLLVRSARAVTPTVAGAILAQGVARGRAAVEEALTEMRRERMLSALEVSCSPSFAIRWLVRRLDAVRAEHLGITVRIDASDRLTAPGRDGIDLCVRYGAGDYPGSVVTRLSKEQVCEGHRDPRVEAFRGWLQAAMP